MGVADMAPIAIAFVFVAVVIGIGATILSEVQAGQVTGVDGCNATAKTACGYAYNNTVDGTSSLAELSSWLPLIALVIAAAVVISILSYFRS